MEELLRSTTPEGCACCGGLDEEESDRDADANGDLRHGERRAGVAHEYTAEQHEHGSPGVSPWQFAHNAEFWFQSFQNWQSEFLAVGTIVVLTVFLRQRGSAESKPVHAPHDHTGDD